jgi:hypothetical protein
VLENRVLRRIFGPKSEEVAGGWKRLRSEELHNLYSTPNVARVSKSRRMRWAVQVPCMEEMRNACSILVGIPERKIPLRGPRCGRKNIGMDLREIGLGGKDLMHLA